MSYTRPLAHAADVTWQGLPAYTRPPAHAADVTWQAATPPDTRLMIGNLAVLAVHVGAAPVLAVHVGAEQVWP